MVLLSAMNIVLGQTNPVAMDISHGCCTSTIQSPPEVDPISHLGSVEKLREALQTPSTGSQEIQYSLRTPGLLGIFLP